jgi:hypothetical protein
MKAYRRVSRSGRFTPGKTRDIPRILAWIGTSRAGNFEEEKIVLPVAGNGTLDHTDSSLVCIPATILQLQTAKYSTKINK